MYISNYKGKVSYHQNQAQTQCKMQMNSTI